MKRVALLLLLLPALGWSQTPSTNPPLGSQSVATPATAAQASAPTITESLLIPPVFSVGDLVELRVTLVLPEGQEVRPIQTLPTQDWLVLRDVQIRHDPPFEHVTIKFIPFAPGEKVLPALVLGDLTLDNLRIATSSVLDKAGGAPTTSGLEPPRDQLPLPHTELILTLVFLLLVILPLAVWRFFHPVLQMGLSFFRYLERHRPYHRLVRESRKLQAKLSGLSGPEFYTLYLQLVRAYLGARLGKDVSTLTAHEVADVLGVALGSETEAWTAMIHRADIVRFDSRNPADAERQADLEELGSRAKTLEDRETHRVDL